MKLASVILLVVACTAVKLNQHPYEEKWGITVGGKQKECKDCKKIPTAAPSKADPPKHKIIIPTASPSPAPVPTMSPTSINPFPQPPICLEGIAIDLVFLIDGSGSMEQTVPDTSGKSRWDIQNEFILYVSQSLVIGPEASNVGVMQFSKTNAAQIDLGQCENIDSLTEAMTGLEWLNPQQSWTGTALNEVYSKMFSGPGNRPDYADVLILVTDGPVTPLGGAIAGDPIQDVTSVTDALKQNGVHIYSVGVGTTDDSQLRDIASDPDELTVFSYNDWSSNFDLYSALTTNICDMFFEGDSNIHETFSPTPHPM